MSLIAFYSSPGSRSTPSTSIYPVRDTRGVPFPSHETMTMTNSLSDAVEKDL